MIGRILMAMGLSVVVVAPVMAQTATPGVDARQERQQQRIDQGIASGELNKREAGRLEREQGRIEADKEAAKADGVVTKQERAKLNREQNRASRHIAREKHDRQKAN
jgi:polyisoprenoid-binding protein YceI